MGRRNDKVAMGLNRRDALRAGGIGLTGLTLPDLLRADSLRPAAVRQLGSGFGQAKSCVILFLKGGPSHLDTFDMKPEAPSEVRGEFQPIDTTAPGVQVCEHLPLLALQADKFAVIRSMELRGDAVHSTAAYEVTTGHRFPRIGEAVMQRQDHPHFGSSVAAAGGRGLSAPPYVMVPDSFVVNGEYRGGQNAGRLGARFDPLIPGGDPNHPSFRPRNLGLELLVDPERLQRRSALLDVVNARASIVDDSAARSVLDQNYATAMTILQSSRTRQAFEVAAEPDSIRDLYGRNFFGQSVLLARRLVEAGVRLVHVNCMSTIVDGNFSWDTHFNNFETLKNILLPRTDQAIAAFLQDLDQRGLLSETLVIVVGEFGRTPRISPYTDKKPGRDHWPYCFSAMLAGAGVSGGRYYGSSNRLGAFPADNPVNPAHLGATIFHALGIAPDLMVHTLDGGNYPIAEEHPIVELWG